MQVLPDSSTIISLAKTGSLHLLKKTFGKVWITEEVEREVTFGNFSEVKEVKRSIGKWIKTLKVKTINYREFDGLGPGEKSILSYGKGKNGVLLILDEIEARAVAESGRIPYTGTIGLIVFAHETRKVSKEEAIDIVKKIARSDFRMTVELYDWALERLK